MHRPATQRAVDAAFGELRADAAEWLLLVLEKGTPLGPFAPSLGTREADLHTRIRALREKLGHPDPGEVSVGVWRGPKVFVGGVECTDGYAHEFNLDQGNLSK